ncbi:ATP-binding protein [Sulfurovum sp.]|uniref:sensor histidine kinase n=1 Tax=Sulfurovum sp. TaxID=1969726 RepID=UPI0025EE94C2|nr:ATP-binding protein [Sulfurovum sp.]
MRQSDNSFLMQDRINLVLKIFNLLIILLSTMSLVRLIEKNYIQFAADILFLLIVLYGYFRLKTNYRNYRFIIRIVFLGALAASTFLLVHYQHNPIRFVWFSTVVYIIFYLFDRKEALCWIGSIGIALFAIYIFDIPGFNLSLVDFLVWVMNMLIVLMISHWYAKTEEASTQKFLQIKDILSDEVAKKTRELQAQTLALEQKTMELQSLNATLEERIQKKIEENREQEKMLFRQARYAQMGEMISMIAHQWRQPLNAISASAAIMQLKLEREDPQNIFFKEKVARIGDYVQHLSSTIDDFRNFFRLDRKKEEREFPEIIDNALSLVKNALEEKNIVLATHYQCTACLIYTYPNEILHVILNLLKNAEDALLMNKISEPKIMIRTMSEQGRVVFEIEDNAGGIGKDIMEKIFDPYFTTKGHSDGTGLGLYMSKVIIEEHCQGKIEVENGARGAIFRLVFPQHS